MLQWTEKIIIIICYEYIVPNRYTAAHTLDLYSEVAAICRPPLALTSSEMGSFKKTQTSSTGYIISVFKVFEGDDGERFENNWLYWTGARMLYRLVSLVTKVLFFIR